MLDYLKILMPRYWVMNYKCSKSLDSKLRSLAEQNNFENFQGYFAQLGDIGLWTANYPYGIFSPYYKKRRTMFNRRETMPMLRQRTRPRRITILRLYRKLIDDILYPLRESNQKYIDEMFYYISYNKYIEYKKLIKSRKKAYKYLFHQEPHLLFPTVEGIYHSMIINGHVDFSDIRSIELLCYHYMFEVLKCKPLFFD